MNAPQLVLVTLVCFAGGIPKPVDSPTHPSALNDLIPCVLALSILGKFKDLMLAAAFFLC